MILWMPIVWKTGCGFSCVAPRQRNHRVRFVMVGGGLWALVSSHASSCRFPRALPLGGKALGNSPWLARSRLATNAPRHGSRRAAPLRRYRRGHMSLIRYVNSVRLFTTESGRDLSLRELLPSSPSPSPSPSRPRLKSRLSVPRTLDRFVSSFRILTSGYPAHAPFLIRGGCAAPETPPVSHESGFVSIHICPKLCRFCRHIHLQTARCL